jgi:hypothetical protein
MTVRLERSVIAVAYVVVGPTSVKARAADRGRRTRIMARPTTRSRRRRVDMFPPLRFLAE